MTVPTTQVVRRRYLARGIVQGVGFRPHVATVAQRFSVTGWVGNDPAQVFIELQGSPDAITTCAQAIFAELPPLATVLSVSQTDLAVRPDEHDFRIAASRHGGSARTLIPPDVAPCAACLAEMRDPDDRRWGHPFISCTDCGPRVSIITDLPYDRPATTMRDFPMCPACAAEYADPDNRRYHAQPISCFECGPALWLIRIADAGIDDALRPTSTTGERAEQAAVVAAAIDALTDGEIVAVKGIGGFHLLCDAENESAVARLRQRKRRIGKPFAILASDLEHAHRLVHLSPTAARLLTAPQRPIVIGPAAKSLAPSVAPGLGDLGVMLPSSPLYELLTVGGRTLVATSANVAAEPLVHRNEMALTQLGELADQILLHDREIALPVEDSVLLDTTSEPIPIRRSRGYAPLPVPLPTDGPTVLAVGGELKNTLTLANGDLAFISAHVGDMGSWAAQQAFDATVRQMLGMHRSEIEVLVCDLHPDYATTNWAERYAARHPQVRLLRVQHHLAHALALLAEHGVTTAPAVIATLDGTGFGTDQAIWGGEILALGTASSSFADWKRVWQVPYFALAGGDRAIRHPWRIAQGLAHSWQLPGAMVVGPPDEQAAVTAQLANGAGVVSTSSAGRLFDAAAAFLGLCQQVHYEAQAAMELEHAASQWTPGPGPIAEAVDLPAVFVELLAYPNRSVAERAWIFHHQLATVLADALADQASRHGADVVGLTGGVALNRLLTATMRRRLSEHGRELLTHQALPPNDGGLSLGQAWAGRLLTH